MQSVPSACLIEFHHVRDLALVLDHENTSIMNCNCRALPFVLISMQPRYEFVTLYSVSPYYNDHL
jgi:hypothetical protein